jgi:hypothetical protein
VNGLWKQTVVDDKIPILANDPRFRGKFIFAKNKGDEFWVNLLEKAYAKAYGGSYLHLNGGMPYRAIRDLTGSAYTNYTLTEYTTESKK